MTIQLFLYLLGAVFLALAAAGVSARRVTFGWLGLFCWLAAEKILPVFPALT